MAKRIREDDLLFDSIIRKDKSIFYKLAIDEKFPIKDNHLELLELQNLLFEWINPETYKLIILDDIFDFIFKYDDIENFIKHFDKNNTHHLYSLLYHNANKCLVHYLLPGNRLFASDGFFHSSLRYAIQHKCSLSIIKTLVESNLIDINQTFKKQKTCLDIAIKYQSMNVIQYLISKNAKFWNHTFTIKTQLEKDYLNSITTSSGLSLCPKQLRSSFHSRNFKTNIDYKLHTLIDDELFDWENEIPQEQYSYLFKELFHAKFYKKHSWNFIPVIESIVQEYALMDNNLFP